jgi:hypothetical protein
VDREVVVEKEVPVPVATPAPAPRKNYGGGANYNVGSWPETSQRYLDPSELYGMSAWEKKIMRNEIYARHGYIFGTEPYKSYYESQPWYQGTISPDQFSDSVFNEYEYENVEKLGAHRDALAQ